MSGSTVLVAMIPGMGVPLYQLTYLDYADGRPLTSASVFPGEYSQVEVPGGAPGVAWVRSSGSRTIRIALTNPMGTAHTATLNVSDFRYDSASGDFALSVSPPSRELSFPAHGQSNVVEFTVSGMPDFVTLGTFSFDLSCESQHATLNGDDLGMRVYLTDSTPLGSSYGYQVPMWTDVLEDACLWATGKTGAADCRWWCTFKLYHSMVFVVAPGGGPRYVDWDDSCDPAVRWYRLRQFFIDRASPPYSWVNGDGQDVSTYLQICLSSLGW